MANKVPRVRADSLTQKEFNTRFAEPNLPVILTDATSSWRAQEEWVREDGSPDVTRLVELFGTHEVTVHARKGAARETTVAEFAQWWEQRKAGDNEWRYLKDWHVAHGSPDYIAYTVPACLGEDWLNEHWRAQRSTASSSGGGDHRFVYLGPAGSVTALHADVLFSYSWSVNVAGHKRWRLVPADQRELVSDPATRPRARALAALPGATPIEVVQAPGEVLFVPSGW